MAEVGTLSLTPGAQHPGRVTEHRLTWTSDGATGAVSGISRVLPSGLLYSVKIIPSLGAAQPSDLFDVTLLDEDSLDLLSGGGANVTNAGATLIMLDPPIPLNGAALQPTFANCGNSKTGDLVVTIAQ